MTTTLEIQNLKCGGCATTIINKLSDMDIISEVIINNDSNSVSFTYKNDNALLKAKTLLFKIGYPVVGEKNGLTTKAKSYVSCAVGRMNK